MVEDDDDDKEEEEEDVVAMGTFGSDDPIVLRRFVVGCVVFLETTNNGDAKS